MKPLTDYSEQTLRSTFRWFYSSEDLKNVSGFLGSNPLELNKEALEAIASNHYPGTLIATMQMQMTTRSRAPKITTTTMSPVCVADSCSGRATVVAGTISVVAGTISGIPDSLVELSVTASMSFWAATFAISLRTV